MKQRRDEILYGMIIQRMKEIRSNHNHSQEYVVENTSLDIPHFESGRYVPSVGSLAIFCEFYEITLDEFFAPLNYPPRQKYNPSVFSVAMSNDNHYHKDKDFAEMIAGRIRQLRRERGFTQEFMIDSIHLDIHRYETGNSIPLLTSISKICEFFNITLDEFFAPLNYPPKK